MTSKMNDAIFDDIAIERACQQQFGLSLTISEVIARNITVGTVSQATLFKTTQHTQYLFIASTGNQTLGDVITIVRNMGCQADAYLPPHGDDDYFHRVGIERFKQMFPGKYIMSQEDTRYYETLAKYNPALVRISKVKGALFSYTIATKQWRKLKDYAYTKMKVA